MIQKRNKFQRNKKEMNSIKFISVFQIVLMISFIFSFSVILNGGFVSGIVNCYFLNSDGSIGASELGVESCAKGWVATYVGPSKNVAAPPPATQVPVRKVPVQKIKGDIIKSDTDTGISGDADENEQETGPIYGQQEQIIPNEGANNGADSVPREFPLGITTAWLGHLVEGAIWAVGVTTAIQLFGPIFGLEENQVNALSMAASVGIMAGKTALAIAPETFATQIGETGLTYAGALGIGIGVLVFILMYKSEKEEIITFECRPWQAPVGGNDCEKCNGKDLPCSEYQCRSLGQACELINKGTKEEKCVWINRQDVNPPVITPWEDALLADYRYNPSTAVSPPDRGVDVLYDKSKDNCIPAFTPLKIGVQLDEPAACKIDTLRKENFEEMSIFMSSGILKEEHEFSLSLPGSEALESSNITVINNGDYELFVRCQDANGNANTATFVFRYCVDKGPDTTPPLIVTTSILNGLPIGFNQSSVNLDVFVNEPAECKWSHDDRDYESMEETMACSSGVFEFNAQSLYKCSTTLTGLKDRVANDFYFRCKDKPNAEESDRNVNVESYKFTLLGTQPLVIDSVKPNKTTVSDSTDTVKVTIEAKTSAGHDKGQAICYYSDTGDENDYIKFFNTASHEHTQDLFLLEGNYEYFIKCVDLGGNTDYSTINFDVEVDSESPKIVRTYKEEDFLKIVTNEDAKCVYSTFDCSYEFEEGTSLTTVNGTGHFTPWNVESSYYVKCQDDFGNANLPNECGIVVKPSEN